MPAFSRFAQPRDLSPDFGEYDALRGTPPADWSLPPSQQNLADVSEHEPRISRTSGLPSAHSRNSHISETRPLYDRNSRGSGSHYERPRASLPSRDHHYRVSDDLGPDDDELLGLRAENNRLKHDIQDLRTRERTTLYVFEYFTRYMH
jgi:hypothetical protein